MSANRFLVHLFRQGLVLRLSEDRTRIVAPRGRLTRELRARMTKDKTELLKLLGFVDEYRTLIRNAFAVMVYHASARTGLRAFTEDQARLTDELGPALTEVIRDGEARQWRRDTGLCPVCGDDNDCDVCREAHQAGAAD